MKEYELILITDDQDRAIKKIKIDGIHFQNNENDIEDLYTLFQCNSPIMSNSTFSWWGVVRKKKQKCYCFTYMVWKCRTSRYSRFNY